MPLKLDTYIITNADIVSGRDHIEGASRAVRVPVVAIGGIDHGNATSCIEAGAAGCAVITAVIGATDMRQAATNLAQIIRDAKMRAGKGRPM